MQYTHLFNFILGCRTLFFLLQQCHPCIERYNEEFVSSDKSHLAEGCFCPNGTMLSSPHSDICVSSCDCIGPDGTPKKLGESWRSNCHDCVCDEASMSVQCQPHVCPVPPTLPCTQEGQVLVTGPMANDSCCNTTTCKCDLSRCPKAEKSCEPGFKPVAQPSEQGCCPVYKCEPRNVCVLNNIEYQPGVIVPVSLCEECQCTSEIDPFTQLHQMQCRKQTCDRNCPAGFRYQEVPGQCCGKCTQVACVFPMPNIPGSTGPGQNITFPGDNCTLYQCFMINGQYVPISTRKACQEFHPDDCVPVSLLDTNLTLDSPNTLRIRLSLDCDEKPRSCTVQKKPTTITHEGCVSSTTVEVSSCKGTCSTYSMYSSEANAMQHKCSCCQELSTSQRSVTLQCVDGSSVPYTYTHIEECGCKDTRCQDSYSDLLLVTASRGRQ
uniref:CTCK domain-containing protein n=1 Tax=Lepisosteus oculatus TaxID=7918 RepID=W5LVB0_LEPOC